MKRILPVLLIGLGVLLVLGPVGWLYFDGLVSHPAIVPLPDEIASLQITDHKTGAQVVAEFKKLHGKQFLLTSGAKGIYGDHQITLWAAGAPLEFMAAGMVNSMRDRISEGDSPFTPINEFKIGGRTIYELDGMEQRHFYFQSNNLIIWLAADLSIANEAIEQILETYP